MKPIEEIRRENLLFLVAKEGSQAAFARRIDKDKNQVNQWLGRANARNISADNAREVERIFGLEPGWLDTPQKERNEFFHGSPAASQAGRIDPTKLAESIAALRQVAKKLGWNYDPETHPAETVMAYELRCTLPDAPSYANVIDFGDKLAERLKKRRAERGEGDGQENGGHVGSGDRGKPKGHSAA